MASVKAALENFWVPVKEKWHWESKTNVRHGVLKCKNSIISKHMLIAS